MCGNKIQRILFGVWLAFALTASLFAQPPQRPQITGVAHISLLAHDFEKTRAFYSQFLGFQEPYTFENADGSTAMTFFKINDRQYIEVAPEHAAGTDRLSHISLETDDIEALRAYLASKGVKVPSEAHRVRIGNLAFNIVDPAGHTVEITQYTPDGWTMKAKGQYMSDKQISHRMTHVGIIVTDLDPEHKSYTDNHIFKEV